MNFDLKNPDQCIDMGSNLMNSYIVMTNSAIKKTSWIRPFVPITFAALHLTALTCRVAHVVELLLKGALNIAGAPLFSQCKATRGLKQIFIKIPDSLYHGIKEAVRFPIDIVSYLRNPQSFVHEIEKSLRDINRQKAAANQVWRKI